MARITIHQNFYFGRHRLNRQNNSYGYNKHPLNNDTFMAMTNKTSALVITDIWARPEARTNVFVRNATVVVGFALLTAIWRLITG